MRIKLSADEIAYLSTASFIPVEFAEQIKLASAPGDASISVDILEDDADALRDMFGEQLQKVGFDAAYNPNTTGQLLERLIDKFLVE